VLLKAADIRQRVMSVSSASAISCDRIVRAAPTAELRPPPDVVSGSASARSAGRRSRPRCRLT
jgi:hypothetical protein